MKIYRLITRVFILVSLFCLVGSTARASSVSSTEVDVFFNIDEGKISGSSTIAVKEPSGLQIFTGNLVIGEVAVDGKVVKIKKNDKDTSFIVKVGSEVKVSFEGSFPEIKFAGGIMPDGVIKKDGIFLTGRWYPSTDFITIHKLKAKVPKKFVAISEADTIKGRTTKAGKEYEFVFPYPVSNINFAAAEYRIVRDKYKDIDVVGYFLPEDISLAKGYISQTKKYLKEYEEMLGPYPYKRFAVVENFLPTGYSMPTFTLLGKSVIRLPFITYTSLGHEIAHQWIGNSVYGDYSEGNWLEGLTSYLSDYRFDREKGKGQDYRKKAIVDYKSYVNQLNDITVKQFRGPNSKASRAVGYGKVMFIFHMLEGHIGEEKFSSALRSLVEEKKFKEVSWSDLESIFSEKSEEDLSWFFDQWLNRKGLAHVNASNHKLHYVEGKPQVSFDLAQVGPEYILNVPIEIVMEKGVFKKVVQLNDRRASYEFTLDSTPVKLIIDKDYDIMRQVSTREMPVTISRLFGDPVKILVVPPGKDNLYNGLVSSLEARGFKVKEEKDVTDSDLRGSSFVVLGVEGRVMKRLFGNYKKSHSEELSKPGFSFSVMKNPLNRGKVMAVAYGTSDDGIRAASRKVSRYGKYKYLRFEKGRAKEKVEDKTVRGLEAELSKELFGYSKKGKVSFDEIINEVKSKRVVYVGEMHDKFSDHRLQLDVIRKLNEKGIKVAIGMEMFQGPSQKALDKFIANKISEREFLRESEFFTRWNMDYVLYSEIITYAKEHNIPIIALNIDKDIFKKVGESGFDSLTDEEKASIPDEMDMSDMEYKDRLGKIYSAHSGHNGAGFERFYQSQVLWDEVMAHGVSDYLKKNKKHMMVVVAGSGHISYKSGIMNRVTRISGLSQASIVSTESGTSELLNEEYNDYVVFTYPIATPKTPKLMAYIKDNDKGVEVADFTPHSVSFRAGIKKGDIITSLDEDVITTLSDLKISLHFRKKGDIVNVGIIRKGFFRTKEMTIKVTL